MYVEIIEAVPCAIIKENSSSVFIDNFLLTNIDIRNWLYYSKYCKFYAIVSRTKNNRLFEQKI